MGPNTLEHETGLSSDKRLEIAEMLAYRDGISRKGFSERTLDLVKNDEYLQSYIPLEIAQRATDSCRNSERTSTGSSRQLLLISTATRFLDKIINTKTMKILGAISLLGIAGTSLLIRKIREKLYME